MNEAAKEKSVAGKWVVAGLIAVSLVLALIRWVYIPKTNPRDADPGNPFYSPPPETPPAETR
jgi:hypothetical protein